MPDEARRLPGTRIWERLVSDPAGKAPPDPPPPPPRPGTRNRWPQADPAVFDAGHWDEISAWLRRIGFDPTARWIVKDGITITIDTEQHAVAHLSIRLTLDDVHAFPLSP